MTYHDMYCGTSSAAASLTSSCESNIMVATDSRASLSVHGVGRRGAGCHPGMNACTRVPENPRGRLGKRDRGDHCNVRAGEVRPTHRLADFLAQVLQGLRLSSVTRNGTVVCTRPRM